MPGKTSGRKSASSTRKDRDSKEVREVVMEVAREVRAIRGEKIVAVPAPPEVEAKAARAIRPVAPVATRIVVPPKVVEETRVEPVQEAPAVLPPPPPPQPVLDLRNCRPIEARAKAFQGMFRVKPGQRIAVYINTAEVEREVMKWVDEIGHRFIKNFRCESNGSAYVTIELIKMEARR
jgi:hypothetical protein